MQTAWPFRSTTSPTGQHASTCSIARLNPLVQTRSRTRYNMPPVVCFTREREREREREITTNNHDFSLGKTALGLSNQTKRDRGTPCIARNSKFNQQDGACVPRGVRRRYTFQTRDRDSFRRFLVRARFQTTMSFHDERTSTRKRGTPIKIVMSLSRSVNC